MCHKPMGWVHFYTRTAELFKIENKWSVHMHGSPFSYGNVSNQGMPEETYTCLEYTSIKPCVIFFPFKTLLG